MSYEIPGRVGELRGVGNVLNVVVVVVVRPRRDPPGSGEAADFFSLMFFNVVIVVVVVVVDRPCRDPSWSCEAAEKFSLWFLLSLLLLGPALPQPWGGAAAHWAALRKRSWLANQQICHKSITNLSQKAVTRRRDPAGELLRIGLRPKKVRRKRQWLAASSFFPLSFRLLIQTPFAPLTLIGNCRVYGICYVSFFSL